MKKQETKHKINMNEKKQTVNVGCGCIPLILLILVLSAWWVGLPTSWGTFNIDIFPPGVYLEK